MLYILTAILNILDAVFTSYFIDIGAARELNPLMKVLLDYGIFYFLAFKFTVISICIFFLWKFKRERYGKIAIKIVFFAYLITMLLHFNVIVNLFLIR